MVINKHERAKNEFWGIMGEKIAGPDGKYDSAKMIALVRHMIEQMPTWGIKSATEMIRDWKPEE